MERNIKVLAWNYIVKIQSKVIISSQHYISYYNTEYQQQYPNSMYSCSYSVLT